MTTMKPSFRFFERGAPFPGACVFSGESNNLWEVGSLVVQGEALPILLSDKVLVEIASFTGMVSKEIHEKQYATLTARIQELEGQIQAAPLLLKELTLNVNSILSDFITALASVPSNIGATQVKSDKADTGSIEAKHGSPAEAGQGKGQGSKPSPKPASK